MNKHDLIQYVAAKTGLPQSTAKKVVEAVLKIIAKSLTSGNEVKLVGFGTFSVGRRAATTGRNPRTGETIQIPGSNRARFRASDLLVDELQGLSLQGAGGVGGEDLLPRYEVAPGISPTAKRIGHSKRIKRRGRRRTRGASRAGRGGVPRAAAEVETKEEEKSQNITVLYGTNRKSKPLNIKLTKPAGADIPYSKIEWSPKLNYGQVEVSIPVDKKMGKLPRPKWWQKEKIGKHVVILKIESFNWQRLCGEVEKKVNRKGEKEGLLYIHGYNTSFVEAARRCAQIAYDLQFDGVPIFFSWPSQGRLRDYFRDGNVVEKTADQLADFLFNLKQEAGLQKFHIISHSMGAKSLAQAFLRISANRKLRENEAIATNTILAAPDIDQDVFRQLAQHVTKYSKSVTLYASKTDVALKLSKGIHGDPRAGDSEPILIINGIDTIDASELPVDFSSHSLYSNNRTVIGDIFNIVKNGLKPEKRHGLMGKNTKKGRYWSFAP